MTLGLLHWLEVLDSRARSAPAPRTAARAAMDPFGFAIAHKMAKDGKRGQTANTRSARFIV